MEGARPARARRPRARQAARQAGTGRHLQSRRSRSRRRRSSLPASRDLLVINTLPWERKVIVEEPEPRGGAAPDGVLDCFFNRGSGWGGVRPIPPVRRIAGTIPAMGYAFLQDRRVRCLRPQGVRRRDREPPLPDQGRSQDRRARRILRQGPAGTILPASIRAGGPGKYIYEEVDSKEGRLAIANIDFAHPDFFVGHKDTPWKRERREQGDGRRSRRSTRAAPRSR